VVTSTDEEVVQLWGLLNESTMALPTRGDWPQLNRTFAFTHQGGENHLALNLFNPIWEDNVHDHLAWASGAAQIKYPTRASIFCTTTGLQVEGPLSDQDWAAMLVQTGPTTNYVWRMNRYGICIYPNVPEVDRNKVWFQLDCTIRETVMSADQLTFKDVFTVDTDLGLLPADILIADLRWRWRSEKGMAYAEHFRVAESLIFDALGKGSGAGIVYLDYDPCYPEVVRPGLLIPAGSWPIR